MQSCENKHSPLSGRYIVFSATFHTTVIERWVCEFTFSTYSTRVVRTISSTTNLRTLATPIIFSKIFVGTCKAKLKHSEHLTNNPTEDERKRVRCWYLLSITIKKHIIYIFRHPKTIFQRTMETWNAWLTEILTIDVFPERWSRKRWQHMHPNVITWVSIMVMNSICKLGDWKTIRGDHLLISYSPKALAWPDPIDRNRHKTKHLQLARS